MTEHEHADPPEDQIQTVEIDQSLWLHRLIIKEGPGEGNRFEPDSFVSEMGKACTVKVFGEVRVGYFLVDAEVAEDGAWAVLTLDFYDLEAMAVNAPTDDGEQNTAEQTGDGGEDGGVDGEGDGVAGHSENITPIRPNETGENGG